MAWTTPTTRATGDLITASIWNTDLVDDLNFLYGLKPLALGVNGSTSAAWPSANAAILVPVHNPGSGSFASVWIYIDNSAGNIDAGIYDSAGARQVSNGGGAAPVAGFAQITWTNTPLAPGRYYWAFSASDTALTMRFTAPASTNPFTQVCRQVATSYPLPASITVGSTAPTLVPAFALPVT